MPDAQPGADRRVPAQAAKDQETGPQGDDEDPDRPGVPLLQPQRSLILRQHRLYPLPVSCEFVAIRLELSQQALPQRFRFLVHVVPLEGPPAKPFSRNAAEISPSPRDTQPRQRSRSWSSPRENAAPGLPGS